MANVIKHKRGSGSDPVASDLVVGEVAIRTDVGKLFTKMDNGSVAEIAGGGSDIIINTLSSSSATGGGSATFNGSAYRFTLSQPPSVSAQQLLVSVNGVIQKPVAGTGQPSEGFSVSGNDIIFGDAPATGSDFFILTFKSLGVSEPADNSVTSAKIVDGAIVNADINASAAIAGSKISPVFGTGGDLTTHNGNRERLAILGSSSNGSMLHIRGGSPAIFFDQSGGNISKIFQDNVNLAFHAGTPATEGINTFFIQADGDVGLGTSSPTRKLHLVGSNPMILIEGSGGNGRQYSLASSDDTTGANVDGGNPGSFAIYDDTANAARLLINSSGNVGIGTTSPQGGLHVQTGTITELNLWSSAGFGRSKFNLRARDTGTSVGLFQLHTESTVPTQPMLMTIRNSGDVMFGTENNDSGGSAIGNNFGFVYQPSGHAIVRSGSTSVSGASGIAYTAKFVDTGTSKAFRVMLAQTEMGSISVGAGGTAFNTSSDYRRKENVVELTDAITRLKTLLPKRFNFIDEPSVTRDGFLAHEVTAVPEAVYGTKDAVEPEDNESTGAKKGDPIYQQLDQSKLVPLLVAALQEAIGRIEVLEAK